MAEEHGERTDWTASELSRLARQLYTRGHWLMRRMQWYRPYICPFNDMLQQIPPGTSVLDVGCGGGLFLALLHRVGRLGDGFGFDSSADAIRIAQHMAQGVNDAAGKPLLRFELRSVGQQWPDGPFDVVSLIDVMHHVPWLARQELLGSIVSRIRPGGRLVYKDMGRQPQWRAWANTVHDLILAREWVQYAPIAWVEATVREMGLRLVHARDINMFCYRHELRVFQK